MFGKLPIAIIILGGFASAEAKTPEWALKNTQSVSGKILKTTCSGTGPSLDAARKDALDSCRLSARQQLVSNVKVRSLTIQTEQSSGFHEEVMENTQYHGLICVPEKDEVEELDGSFRVWMQCRFDLAKVKAIASNDPGDQPSTQQNSTDEMKNRESLATVENRPITRAVSQNISSSKTTLTISSIPNCESLIIRGPQARVVTCKENPMSIILEESDSTIIVRAKGYKTKTISLGKERRSHDHVDVILDPM